MGEVRNVINTENGSWVEQLADWLLAEMAGDVPGDVLHIAARSTVDSFACAIAALNDPAALAVLEVVKALGGSPDCLLFGTDLRVPATGAVLYNGSLIRSLDCNDIFFAGGPTGHPSDNIAVALAVAEKEHASGRDLLAATAIGYELFFRLLIFIRYHSIPSAFVWDEVSVSGMVGAAIAGLLMKLDRHQLANAIAIAGINTYTLRQVRTGEISMLKASANALVANAGLLAALLAKAGMTGPPELFEGERGMLSAMGIEVDHFFHDEVLVPIDQWKISNISIKPYPSIGTSQSVIAATLQLINEHAIKADDVERLEIRLADLPTARRQIANPFSERPQTRETADHSLPFLVAMCLQDGEFGPDQYEGDPWLRESTQSLIDRVDQLTDADLNGNAEHGYPAVVTIETRDGKTYRQEMLAVPGSPARPFTDQELKDKFMNLTRKSYATSHCEELFDEFMNLATSGDVAELASKLQK